MAVLDETGKAEMVAHAWQAHRIKCLELAIQAGAPPGTAMEWAEKFSTYILTKSELEKGQVASRASSSNDAGD